jgi:glycosyltransferase involved in cell wall biosynthesis
MSGRAEAGVRAPPTGVSVDVGIPTYGSPTYLGEAIESVLGQTRADWRLLISEDGAGSPEVAAVVGRYASDGRIGFRSTGTHVGAAANLTGLIREGTAPYVAILHDDDRWEPGFLDARVRFLDAEPECGLVFSGNTDIDARGATTGRSSFSLAEGLQERESFVPLLFGRNVISAPTVVVRRSAFEALGRGFDERFPVMYDYEMWLRLALRFPVGFLARWDAAYRRHDRQTTFLARGTGAEWLRLLDHFDELAAAVPGRLRVSDRRRSAAFLSAALDALEDRRPADAWQLTTSALRAHPPSVLDPRLCAALAGLALGPLSPPLLGRARRFTHRRGIRLHLDTP